MASPQNTVWRLAVEVPELGVTAVSARSWKMLAGATPVTSCTSCVHTVATPWPMHAALVRMRTMPSSTARRQRPMSGRPTPTPLFFMAPAMPA